MDSAVKVKASLKFEEIRLLEILPSSISLEGLKNDVKNNFPLLNQQNVLLKLSWIGIYNYIGCPQPQCGVDDKYSQTCQCSHLY